ncbi:hypothetical protein STSV1pORF60 [Sulfolobus virus STSV1]|uniref:hypothetical protein n=1 Tax=Sulfolobus virus STSV1 TaxID=285013 RepID=UPI000042B12A|nr:hypothetical protein STSV1pORF60 [Sulfolobus virus STSV1]CAH04243.1 hypothetical protein [Sulfolobus virus STSV1]
MRNVFKQKIEKIKMMTTINAFQLDELKTKLYYEAFAAGMQSIINEFYKKGISPIQISDEYVLDDDYFNQQVTFDDNGTFKIISTIRHYSLNGEKEILIDFIYTQGEQKATMQIIARTNDNIFVGPEIDYQKYLEIYYDVVDKLASELDSELDKE